MARYRRRSIQVEADLYYDANELVFNLKNDIEELQYIIEQGISKDYYSDAEISALVKKLKKADSLITSVKKSANW